MHINIQNKHNKMSSVLSQHSMSIVLSLVKVQAYGLKERILEKMKTNKQTNGTGMPEF